VAASCQAAYEEMKNDKSVKKGSMKSSASASVINYISAIKRAWRSEHPGVAKMAWRRRNMTSASKPAMAG
jgi:hypothetical protein